MKTMIIETERLILRPWKETDAEMLYCLAQNPKIGPIAGWPVHTDIENSLHIIRDILSAEHTFAVTLKNADVVIGSVGLMIGAKSNLGIGPREAEIGYWLGEPYWGNGYTPEAALELLKYAFEKLHMATIWCAFSDGNEKSKRVSEKCGFRFQYTMRDVFCQVLNQTKTQHITSITKKEWYATLLK